MLEWLLFHPHLCFFPVFDLSLLHLAGSIPLFIIVASIYMISSHTYHSALDITGVAGCMILALGSFLSTVDILHFAGQIILSIVVVVYAIVFLIIGKIEHDWEDTLHAYEIFILLLVVYVLFAVYWWTTYGYLHLRREDWKRISETWSMKLETVERLAKQRGGYFPEFQLHQRYRKWDNGQFPPGINWEQCLQQFVDDMNQRHGGYIV